MYCIKERENHIADAFFMTRSKIMPADEAYYESSFLRNKYVEEFYSTKFNSYMHYEYEPITEEKGSGSKIVDWFMGTEPRHAGFTIYFSIGVGFGEFINKILPLHYTYTEDSLKTAMKRTPKLLELATGQLFRIFSEKVHFCPSCCPSFFVIVNIGNSRNLRREACEKFASYILELINESKYFHLDKSKLVQKPQQKDVELPGWMLLFGKAALKAAFKSVGAELDIDLPFDNSGGDIDGSDFDSSDFAAGFDGLSIDGGDFSSDYGGNISFGSNMYDDNTAKFLQAMQDNGLEIPDIVDHHDSYITRGYGGGLSGIDKGFIRRSILDAFNDGDITKNVKEDLLSKLSKC